MPARPPVNKKIRIPKNSFFHPIKGPLANHELTLVLFQTTRSKVPEIGQDFFSFLENKPAYFSHFLALCCQNKNNLCHLQALFASLQNIPHINNFEDLISRGDPDCIGFIIDKHIEIAAQDPDFSLNPPDEAGNTPLHFAAQHAKTALVEKIVNALPNADCTNHLNQTPLLLAIIANHFEAFKLLLEATEDVNIPEKIYSYTALHYAAQSGRDQMVSLLIQKAKNTKKTYLPISSARCTPFSLVVKLPAIHRLFLDEIMTLLTVDNPNPLIPFDPLNTTLLHHLAVHLQTDACKQIISLLTANEMSIEPRTIDGETPFDWAWDALLFMAKESTVDLKQTSNIIATYFDILEIFISSSQFRTELCPFLLQGMEFSPFKIALAHKKYSSVDLFLSKLIAHWRSNPTLDNREGFLWYNICRGLVYRSNAETLCTLLQEIWLSTLCAKKKTTYFYYVLEAIITVDRGEKYRPLIECMELIADWLIALQPQLASVKLNAPIMEGNTFLHFAAEHNLSSIVRKITTALEKLGDEVDCLNMKGQTPLWLATKKNHYESFKLLLKRTKDVNLAPHNTKTTPLHLAANSGYYQMVNALIQKAQQTNTSYLPLNSKQETPFEFASCNATYKLFLNAIYQTTPGNPNPLVPGDPHSSTLLHLAASHGTHQLCQTLIEDLLSYAENPLVLDLLGRTPLTRALKNLVNNINLLKEHKQDYHFYQDKILKYSCTVDVFLRSSAPNMKLSPGVTVDELTSVFNYAIFSNSKEIVRLLLPTLISCWHFDPAHGNNSDNLWSNICQGLSYQEDSKELLYLLTSLWQSKRPLVEKNNYTLITLRQTLSLNENFSISILKCLIDNISKQNVLQKLESAAKENHDAEGLLQLLAKTRKSIQLKIAQEKAQQQHKALEQKSVLEKTVAEKFAPWTTALQTLEASPCVIEAKKLIADQLNSKVLTIPLNKKLHAFDTACIETHKTLQSAIKGALGTGLPIEIPPHVPAALNEPTTALRALQGDLIVFQAENAKHKEREEKETNNAREIEQKVKWQENINRINGSLEKLKAQTHDLEKKLEKYKSYIFTKDLLELISILRVKQEALAAARLVTPENFMVVDLQLSNALEDNGLRNILLTLNMQLQAARAAAEFSQRSTAAAEEVPVVLFSQLSIGHRRPPRYAPEQETAHLQEILFAAKNSPEPLDSKTNALLLAIALLFEGMKDYPGRNRLSMHIRDAIFHHPAELILDPETYQQVLQHAEQLSQATNRAEFDRIVESLAQFLPTQVEANSPVAFGSVRSYQQSLTECCTPAYQDKLQSGKNILAQSNLVFKMCRLDALLSDLEKAGLLNAKELLSQLVLIYRDKFRSLCTAIRHNDGPNAIINAVDRFCVDLAKNKSRSTVQPGKKRSEQKEDDVRAQPGPAAQKPVERPFRKLARR